MDKPCRICKQPSNLECTDGFICYSCRIKELESAALKVITGIIHTGQSLVTVQRRATDNLRQVLGEKVH